MVAYISRTYPEQRTNVIYLIPIAYGHIVVKQEDLEHS